MGSTKRPKQKETEEEKREGASRRANGVERMGIDDRYRILCDRSTALPPSPAITDSRRRRRTMIYEPSPRNYSPFQLCDSLFGDDKIR